MLLYFALKRNAQTIVFLIFSSYARGSCGHRLKSCYLRKKCFKGCRASCERALVFSHNYLKIQNIEYFYDSLLKSKTF